MVRTLFIGLDGATFTVLDHLTADVPGQGVVMPFFKSVMERGYRSRLRSTANPLTPPAWVSLMTGRNPGQHGVFDFVRFHDRGDEIFFTLYDSRDIREETLWSIASRSDRTVVSLNFPMMAPPSPVNGSMISGFVSWKHLRRSMYPASLYDRVKQIPEFNAKELAWDFERESQIGEVMDFEELQSWVSHHLPREEQWFRISEAMLEQDQPDLFAVMFDGTDKIQHQAWAVLDPALQPDQPSDEHRQARELVLTYFSRLDGYIKRLVELAGPDAQVFFASDHGFTASTEVVRINSFLEETGYLSWRKTGDTEQEKRRAESNFAYLDWENTTAFCPTPSSNGIYIRVADGNGRPGIAPAEYEAFRRKLISDLEELKCPDSGENIIKKIMVREEAFAGAAMGDAPDLTLVLRDFGFVSVRNKLPVVQPRPIPLGTHHPDGIFVAFGPGVASAAGELMSIVDVTPVLLHSLGLEVPENFDGSVPDDLFTPIWLSDRPVRIGPPTVRKTNGQDGDRDDVSDQEKEKIMNQLRALGYLED